MRAYPVVECVASTKPNPFQFLRVRQRTQNRPQRRYHRHIIEPLPLKPVYGFYDPIYLEGKFGVHT